MRRAEFEALFATAVSARRVGQRHLRLRFVGGEELAETVRDLAARESACCSFFDFVIAAEVDRVVLDVRVPPARGAVLDGMAELANAGVR